MLVQHVAACVLTLKMLIVRDTTLFYHIDPFPVTGAASSVSPARSIFSTISMFELVNALSRTLIVSAGSSVLNQHAPSLFSLRIQHSFQLNSLI